MADDDRDLTSEPESAEASSTEREPTGAPRSRSAAAQAASRARRMGSRPTPGGRARPGPVPSASDTATSTAAATADADAAPDAGTEAAEPPTVAAGSPSRPAARTRVAGRRPVPGPRDDDDAGDDADAVPTRTRATRRHAEQPAPRRSKTSSRSVWLRWLPAGVVAALVIALAIVDVLMLQDFRNQSNRTERREQLIASVNAGITKLLSYDYRHLDQDKNAASAYLTGTFRDQYVASMDSTVKKNAPTEKAVVVGEVGSSALTSVSGDGKQAVLLVLGQQTVTNVKQPTPRNEIVSLRVTAQLVHGKWLVSDLARL